MFLIVSSVCERAKAQAHTAVNTQFITVFVLSDLSDVTKVMVKASTARALSPIKPTSVDLPNI